MRCNIEEFHYKNDQEEFNKISEKLGKLSTDFSNNVLDATNKWFLILNKKSEVDGLPERVLELMAISAHNHLKKDEEVDIKNGPWKLSLDIQLILHFMTYATDRNLREKLQRHSLVGHLKEKKIILKSLKRYYLLELNKLIFSVIKVGQN